MKKKKNYWFWLTRSLLKHSSYAIIARTYLLSPRKRSCFSLSISFIISSSVGVDSWIFLHFFKNSIIRFWPSDTSWEFTEFSTSNRFISSWACLASAYCKTRIGRWLYAETTGVSHKNPQILSGEQPIYV